MVNHYENIKIIARRTIFDNIVNYSSLLMASLLMVDGIFWVSLTRCQLLWHNEKYQLMSNSIIVGGVFLSNQATGNVFLP